MNCLNVLPSVDPWNINYHCFSKKRSNPFITPPATFGTPVWTMQTLLGGCLRHLVARRACLRTVMLLNAAPYHDIVWIRSRLTAQPNIATFSVHERAFLRHRGLVTPPADPRDTQPSYSRSHTPTHSDRQPYCVQLPTHACRQCFPSAQQLLPHVHVAWEKHDKKPRLSNFKTGTSTSFVHIPPRDILCAEGRTASPSFYI